MTARLPFTEIAVRRAIRAARKEGVHVAGFTIRPDGTITVHEGEQVVGLVPVAHHAASSEYEDFKA